MAADTTHLATRSRVLEVLEHRNVLARREERVVCIRPRDDRAEHDGLVGLVLEVPVPELVEFGAHLLQLLLSGTDLEAGIDRVRGEPCFLRAGLPLGEELPLNVLITTEEVVEGRRLV